MHTPKEMNKLTAEMAKVYGVNTLRVWPAFDDALAMGYSPKDDGLVIGMELLDKFSLSAMRGSLAHEYAHKLFGHRTATSLADAQGLKTQETVADTEAARRGFGKDLIQALHEMDVLDPVVDRGGHGSVEERIANIKAHMSKTRTAGGK